MSKLRRYLAALAAAGVALFWSLDSEALDPPHDVLQCSDCHTAHGASYPLILGKLCEECHYNGGPAPEAATHSSRLIDNGYGNWEVDCWGCHDPHSQEQFSWDPSYNGKLVRRYLNAPIKEINPDDPGPYWSPLSTIRTETSDIVEFDADFVGPGFVDGDAESADDICQTCHEQTSNYNHPGGFLNSHTDYGADSQPGGNCMACHSHADGFAVAGGGGCTSCHAELQPPDPPPAGQYRRQVAGSGGDFERVSHHVTDGTTTEIVADADCQVCHAQDNHQNNTDPQVRLYDADNQATIYTYDGSGSSLESFCLSCHDADGSAVNGAQPFGDGRTPPDVATGWNATGSPHAGNAQGCLACHGGFDSTDASPPAYEHNVHGACSDVMLSGRVDDQPVTPTVTIVRVDKAAAGRNEWFRIRVNTTLVAEFQAARNDTPDIVRDGLLTNFNNNGEPVTAEVAGPIGIAVLPSDACTSFTTDIVGSDDSLAMTVTEGIRAASYVCLGCHDGSPAPTRDIAAEFNVDPNDPTSLAGFWLGQTGSALSKTHDLNLAMDCSDCHDPHATNGLGFADTDPRRTLRADPDPSDGWAPGDDNDDGVPDSNSGGNLWPRLYASDATSSSSWLSEWCLACHDGSFPPSIRQPASLVNIYNSWLDDQVSNAAQHGVKLSGADMRNDGVSGYPDGGAANTVLNCEACHVEGHNADSNLYQTRTNPLDASGNSIPDSLQYGTIEPISDASVDGPRWCTACHNSDMGNPSCDGCHNHGDSRF